MQDYDKVIVFTAFASYFSAIVQGVCTFGDGVTFHLLWHTAFLIAPDVMTQTPFGNHQLQPATLILSIRAVAVQAVFSYRSRKALCYPLLRVAMPLQVIMIVLGSLVLSRFHASAWLKPGLGVLFGVIAVFFAISNGKRVYRQNQEQKLAILKIKEGSELPMESSIKVDPQAPESDVFVITRTHQIGVAIGSFTSGFLAGLVGVAGPPLMIVTLLLHLPQRVLRGTFPFVFFVGYTIRFCTSVAGDLYNHDAWMLYVAGVIGGVAGLPVGLELGGLLPHDIVALSICWLIFFAAVALAELQGVWVALSVFLCFLTLFGYALVKYRLKQRRKRAIAQRRAELAARGQREAQQEDSDSDEEHERNPNSVNLKGIEHAGSTHHEPPKLVVVEPLLCGPSATLRSPLGGGRASASDPNAATSMRRRRFSLDQSCPVSPSKLIPVEPDDKGGRRISVFDDTFTSNPDPVAALSEGANGLGDDPSQQQGERDQVTPPAKLVHVGSTGATPP